MKPLDPRLLRQAGAARGFLVVTVALGLGATALILVQAGLLARVLAAAAAARPRPPWPAPSPRCCLSLPGALLADPALLILDEPTAHLDPANQRSLTADLLAATAGRTTLLITHDLDGLAEVDEVVALDHGRVVERGTHACLLTAGGYYARMWVAAHGARRPGAERPRTAERRHS